MRYAESPRTSASPASCNPVGAFIFGSLTGPVLSILFGWGLALWEGIWGDIGSPVFLNILGIIAFSIFFAAIAYPFAAISGGLFLGAMMWAEERFVLARNPLIWAAVGGLFAFPTASWVGRDYNGRMALFSWWIILCGVIGAAVGWWVYYGKSVRSNPETHPEQCDRCVS